MMLFAVIVKQNHDRAWKSLRHEDGELCFGGGWFIVGIDTPEGSYTYHYEDNYYSLFDCEELERGKHWDGHTEKDVTRLLSLPKAQISSEDTTSDLISRQAAIDALHTWFRDGFDEDKWWNSTHVLAAIEGLPPVQPEQYWETCFDCPLSHGCPKIKGCTNEQAVNYAGEIPGDCPLSAQPEPKEGHWIPHESPDGGEQYECSECGVLWEFNDGTPEDNEAYFCPKCGAKMTISTK
jgi:DNA-directed RNA polymerase subunit RPC12/RpoP